MRYSEGAVVPVGAVIALLDSESTGLSEEPENPNGLSRASQKDVEIPYLPQKEILSVGVAESAARFYSPLVLNIARQEAINMAELERIQGSGRDGRVTKKDILQYVENRNSLPQVRKPIEEKAPLTTGLPITQIAPRKFTHTGPIEVLEMDRMRKMIADNMIYSTQVSAHVTSFVEADVSALVQWRLKQKDAFQQKYNEALTFTPLFLQALIKALREFPLINASVDGDKILIKKDINIGVAVALPNDNLIVPVIKQADRLNLVGLAASVNDLALRARNNKLKPDELEGGTYTLSNVGVFGNVMGTPIIMQPQVAILAVGAIRKVPAVLETPMGDVIAIRQKMFLSHSYDHRIIDGAMGGRFVRRVADLLEAWEPETLI
jgi:2-oxoglutarate dehydrogenase E2 component (dihydrolipoamide succinyltransferase)